MKIKLDDKDKKILEILQEEAMLPVRAIAEKISLSFTPTYGRIKSLEEQGVISKYVAKINPKEIGLGITAYCSLKLTDRSKEARCSFETALNDMPEIMEAVAYSGQSDYLLKIVATDIDAYNRFLVDRFSALPHLGAFQSNIVLSDVKSGGVITIP